MNTPTQGSAGIAGIAMGSGAPLGALVQQMRPAPSAQGVAGIPPDLVGVLLQQAKRDAEQAAVARMTAMQAAQQLPPGQGGKPMTIAQQLAQQAQPPATGIADAHIPEQDYREGGIVQFSDGGGVRAQVLKNLEGNDWWYAQLLRNMLTPAAEAPDVKAPTTEAPPAAGKWAGTRLPPEYLAQLQKDAADGSPDAQAALAAYNDWYAQQPHPQPPAPMAREHGSPAGATPRNEKQTASADVAGTAPAIRAPQGLEKLLVDRVSTQLKAPPADHYATARARFDKDVGTQDQRAVEALKARYEQEAQAAAPKEGIMNLLKHIALNSKDDEPWWKSGVRGATAAEAENAALAAKRLGLTEKQLQLQQQMDAAAHGTRKERYGVGMDAEKAAATQQKDAQKDAIDILRAQMGLEGTREHISAQLKAAESAAARAVASGNKAELQAAVGIFRAELASRTAELQAMRKEFNGLPPTETQALALRRKQQEVADAQALAAHYTQQLLGDSVLPMPAAPSAPATITRKTAPTNAVVN